MIRWMMHTLYRKADRIVSVTDGISRFLEGIGIEPQVTVEGDPEGGKASVRPDSRDGSVRTGEHLDLRIELVVLERHAETFHRPILFFLKLFFVGLLKHVSLIIGKELFRRS